MKLGVMVMAEKQAIIQRDKTDVALIIGAPHVHANNRADAPAFHCVGCHTTYNSQVKVMYRILLTMLPINHLPTPLMQNYVSSQIAHRFNGLQNSSRRLLLDK
jgi:hypothetical protein